MENDEFLKQSALLKTRDNMEMVTSSVFMIVCFIIGVLALFGIMPLPRSLDDSLQPYAQFSWATMLILGSTLSFVGRLRVSLETEASGGIALALAFMTYVIAIVSNNFSHGLVVAAVFLALAVKYGYKGYVLNKLAKEMRGNGR